MTASQIRAHRKLLGYSVAEFAEALGVKTQTVYKWEGGFVAPGRSVQILMMTLAAKPKPLAVELVKKGKEKV